MVMTTKTIKNSVRNVMNDEEQEEFCKLLEEWAGRKNSRQKEGEDEGHERSISEMTTPPENADAQDGKNDMVSCLTSSNDGKFLMQPVLHPSGRLRNY